MEKVKETVVTNAFATALDWILGLGMIALGILRFLFGTFFEMSNPVDFILSVYYM